MAFGQRVKRRRDGSIDIELGEEEREVLRHVLGQLRDAMLVDADDATLKRLFPPAYADDPDKEAGFKALARDELLESRLAAIDAVEETLEKGSLAAEEADAWVRSLNALRLVLGTRLDVQEEVEPDIDPDDDDAPAWILYYFLSGLVAELVDALAADL